MELSEVGGRVVVKKVGDVWEARSANGCCVRGDTIPEVLEKLQFSTELDDAIEAFEQMEGIDDTQ